MSRSIKTYTGMTNKIRDNGDFRGGRIDGNWIRKLPSTVFVRSKAEEWTQWFSLYSWSAFLCIWKKLFFKEEIQKHMVYYSLYFSAMWKVFFQINKISHFHNTLCTTPPLLSPVFYHSNELRGRWDEIVILFWK